MARKPSYSWHAPHALLMAVLLVAGGMGGIAPGQALAHGQRLRTPGTAHAPRVALSGSANCAYPPPETCIPPLYYGGGLVQHHPQLYVVLWGPEWQSGGSMSDDGNTIQSLLRSLARSDYNLILHQYTDHTGDYVHNDTTLVDAWNDTSTPPSSGLTFGGGIYNEVYNAISKHSGCTTTCKKWTLSNDAQFIVIPQDTTTVDNSNPYACGAHTWNAAMTMVYSYVDTKGTSSACKTLVGNSDPLKEIQGDLTHEYAEAATDPFGDGWRAHDSQASEVGDLCEGDDPVPFPLIDTASGLYVQDLWDQSENACSDVFGNVAFTSPVTNAVWSSSGRGHKVSALGTFGCSSLNAQVSRVDTPT